MKIIKLNRNFNINKYYGFEIGVKFDIWGQEARAFEKTVANRFGQHAWAWKFHPDSKVKEDWACSFGKRIKNEATPYWIYLRKESMLTMLLLSIEHN